MSEHCVAQGRGKKVAGNEGVKTDDLSRADLDPFRIGSGQTHRAIKIGKRNQEAADLGLCAAHHIGGAGLAQAGQDMHDNARVTRWRVDGALGFGERAGHRRIGRLDPALPCPNHAAGNQGRLPVGVEVSADKGHQRSLACIGDENTHAPVTGQLCQHTGFGIHDPSPQIGCVQVNGYPVCLSSHRLSRRDHAAVDDQCLTGHHAACA